MRQWYEKSAAQGDANAQHTLGLYMPTAWVGRRTMSKRGNGMKNPQHRGMPTASFFSGYCLCKEKECPTITRRPCYGFVWP